MLFVFLIVPVFGQYPAPRWNRHDQPICIFKNWDGVTLQNDQFAVCGPLTLMAPTCLWGPDNVRARPTLAYDRQMGDYCFLQCRHDRDCPRGQECGNIEYRTDRYRKYRARGCGTYRYSK